MGHSYSAFVGHEQNVRVNILDADTKKIIKHNFYIQNDFIKTQNVSQTDKAYYFKNSFVMGGSDTYVCTVKANSIYVSDVGYSDYYITDSQPVLCKFELNESQVRALGYDFSSITGNEVMPEIEPISQLPLLPEVVNIYMRKL